MADEQVKPTVPTNFVQDIAQAAADVPNVVRAPGATVASVVMTDGVVTGVTITHGGSGYGSVEKSALDLKDHISQAIAIAALSAGQAVRDEERRLKLLGAKVAGPFGRFWRACKAAGVAFLMTLHAQS